MNTQVVVKSLAISKNSDKLDFQKYNIEVSLEEIENRVTNNKLNYGLTLLSIPKNVRISVEGTTSFSGTEQECVQALEKDENGIPHVLHLIYQDIFPTIFMTTKVVGAPCPAYRLAQISTPSEIPESNMPSEKQVSENTKSGFGEMNPGQKGMKELTEDEIEESTEQKESTEPEQPHHISHKHEVTEKPATPEQPVAAPEKPATPEQPVAAPEKPATPEQPVAAPEKPATPEQPVAAPEKPATPEQPVAAPEKPATYEKKPEEMSLNELNQLYTKLGSEYQNNPSDEIGEKLQNVTDLIQKRQQEEMITESSM